jgi:hypothetical protein
MMIVLAMVVLTGSVAPLRLFAIEQPATTAQGRAAAPPMSVEDSQLRGFKISLALGEMEQKPPTGDFTVGAEKALADVKGFLPYKSYRLLDTITVFGLSGPHQFLQGPDGQKHEFFMRATLVSASAVKVDMLRLWDVADSKGGAATLIDTDFNIKVGETVVVGTSRIDSTKGLILLVTAAAR